MLISQKMKDYKKLEERIHDLEMENEELKERLKTLGRRWVSCLNRGAERAKQIEAIKLILNADFVLDTSNGEKKIVAFEELPKREQIRRRAFYKSQHRDN